MHSLFTETRLWKTCEQCEKINKIKVITHFHLRIIHSKFPVKSDDVNKFRFEIYRKISETLVR